MAPAGIRKAALLLAGLDPQCAAELLKAAHPDTVTRIAAELAYLDASGQAEDNESQPLQEFFGLLRRRKEANLEARLRRMLEGAVGAEQSRTILTEVRRLVDQRDPFIPIRAADVESLGRALAGEHPQVAALVLAELDPDKSARVLPLLEEKARGEAVRRMTAGEGVSPEARQRIASVVRARLDQFRREGDTGVAPAQEERLRKVALLLRGLATELRDNLVSAIAQHDQEIATTVQDLMVLWEDLPIIEERNLQEVLRNVDAKFLALSLVDAPEEIEERIRNNISERAAAMIDEERSLMKKPKPDEIEAARERILGYLRQLNASGDLGFEES